MLGFLRCVSASRSSVCTTEPFVLFSKGMTPMSQLDVVIEVKMLGMSCWAMCVLFLDVGYADSAAFHVLE